ncbi:YigZ family protein [Clostridium sp. OS1-26]|uniref:YigZ family protein n=1 Tax=Clostridium sp. OS1-26 TaxID=3070681 RepID=UPI0027E03803|nr:YigZ family protein [Clostridium sp. OS1-26]WML35772.1 YigZ family protein [Clostridium sp. OS1-26]
MGYFTIKDEVSSQFEEKKSIFIGHVKRVYSEDEAKEFINKIKNEQKEARHNVYAYVIGQNMGIQRYSDDGEPQGTGGVPVLEVIKKNEITDVVVVVTRYFGGILLGKGGLVRAYSKGAAMAVNDGGIVEKVKGVIIDIILEYDMLGKVQYLFEQKLWHIENTDYTDKVKLLMYCEVDKLEEVQREIIEATNGKCEIIVGDEEYYFKLDNRLFKENI